MELEEVIITAKFDLKFTPGFCRKITDAIRGDYNYGVSTEDAHIWTAFLRGECVKGIFELMLGGWVSLSEYKEFARVNNISNL